MNIIKSFQLTGVILLLLILLSQAGSAQELQVSIDKKGKIQYINAKLEKSLQLFTEYSDFQEARLYQTSENSYVLEVSYKVRDKILKIRLPLSIQELEGFRQKVTARIQLKQPQVMLDHSGRTKLIFGSMLLSLGFYGWALPAALDVDDGKSAVALYMLISSSGFYLPFSITQDRPVSSAAANLYVHGGTRGIIHAMLLHDLLNKHDSDEGILASGVAGSIAEAIAGFHLANRFNITEGSAEVIGIGGDFGMGLGLGTAHLLDFFDDDREQAGMSSILLGAGLGYWGGALLANHQSYSKGDAHILGTTGLLGAYLSLALTDLSKTKKDKVKIAVSMAGAVAGLGLGNKLLYKKNFTSTQGNLIRLSTTAGGLLGLGVAYLASSEGKDNDSLYLTASSVGSAAGFWLMYNSYAKDTRTVNKNSSLNINIRPEGLFSLKSGNHKIALPLLSVSYRF